MNAPDPAPTAGASPALAAFLRGMGRRALLFADLLAGSRGQATVAAMLPEFVDQAARRPMAHWPDVFWTQVLALPALPTGPVASGPPALAEALAALGAGPRRAVLLWLVAGLDEVGAAAALGVAPSTWRLALQRAAPRNAAGAVDDMALQGWAAAVQEALREVPAERLAWWDHQCEHALRGVKRDPVSRHPDIAATPRWLLPVLWTGVGLCVLALAASFYWVPAGDAGNAQEPDTGRIRVRSAPLPAAAAPAAAFDADFAVRSHRDLALLANGDEAVLRELDFHAWHAAQLGAGPVEPIAPAAAVGPPALPRRIAAWQALPESGRALLRERWQAWEQMPATQRAAVEDAVATFNALAPEAQQALRLAFAKLPDAERRGWLLGPRLGQAWPRLEPLLMQVPAAEREPLLQVLHDLSPLQLDDLATLAQRTPPQDRDALRRELQSTAASNRSAWLRERLRR